jgi:cell division protein FtsQ
VNRKTSIATNVVLLLCITAYLAGTLVHSRRQWNKIICNSLNVKIIDSTQNRFIKQEDIAAILRANGQNYFGKKLSEISTSTIENILNNRSLIKQAEAYTSVDGVLHIDILQRKPIARVYASNGTSFYVDYDGYVIPPQSTYTSYVPIVNGHISSPFPRNYKGSMLTYFGKNVIDSTYLQLYALTKYIDEHPFWKAQVEQIYFTKNGAVEFIPRVGAHIIRLGDLRSYRYKLSKLATLYEKGLPFKGWNTYEVIDLSYSNQVVCKKK